ncbi:hypothetical protein [Sinomonas atrocyanea]
MNSAGGTEEAGDGGGAPDQASQELETMLTTLQTATGVDFSAYENRCRVFLSGAQLSIQDSQYYGALLDIHTQLSQEYVVGKIRAIDAWADGESQFRVTPKSWRSLIDKLYRINIEDNKRAQSGLPPFILSNSERVAGADYPNSQKWVTPDQAHLFADDLLRTKFVVPFADGVVDVSERIQAAIESCGLPRFYRFHAKDSGYHARHHYALIPVQGYYGDETTIALEVKVLTKMQDTLGELTHLLYEQKRTGRVASHEKPTLAWLFGSQDFVASYVGHAGHFIEASLVGLKNQIHGLENTGGQS